MKKKLVWGLVAVLVVGAIWFFKQEPKVKVKSILPVRVGENLRGSAYVDFLQQVEPPLVPGQKIIAAMLYDVCGSCSSGNLLLRLDSLQQARPDLRIFIALPYTYADRDLRNIKNNNGFSLTFVHMSEAVEQFVEQNNWDLRKMSINGTVLILDDQLNLSYLKLVYQYSNAEALLKRLREQL